MKLQPKLHKEKTGIYCIRNIETNKVYIGKALDIYRRVKAHITDLNTRRQKSENQYFINAWHKYGSNKFEYFVLEYLEKNENLLKERELHWIKEYDSINPEKGYNLRMDSSTNLITHYLTREKQSNNMKIRMKDLNLRKILGEKSSLFWKNNPEVKREMSERGLV